MRNILALKVSRRTARVAAHLSCNFRQIFFATYVLQPLTAVAALYSTPLGGHCTSPRLPIFAHLASSQSMAAIVPDYSTKWHRLAFPLCAAAAAAATLWPSA